jgi:hypothetical protein
MGYYSMFNDGLVDIKTQQLAKPMAGYPCTPCHSEK